MKREPNDNLPELDGILGRAAFAALIVLGLLAAMGVPMPIVLFLAAALIAGAIVIFALT